MTTTAHAASASVTDPFAGLDLARLRVRQSIKWRQYPPDVLPLWVAEMDVHLAEPVVEALVHAAYLGDTGYPVAGPYIESVVAFAAARWAWRIDPAAAMVVPDVMNGAMEAIRVLTEPGDAVVVNAPVYGPFRIFSHNTQRRIVEAPLSADARIDLDTLAEAYAEARAGGRPAAHLISNPHNPTGTVHTAAELAAVAALAAEHGIRVVVDEIHAPLVYPGATFVPYLTVPGAGAGFSLLSASKAWNLAGIKAAVLVAGDDARADLARVPKEVSFGASHLGLLAQTAAYRDGGPWLDALVASLDANRQLLATLLAERLPTVGYRPPAATYLAWLDCRALGLGDDPSAAFLERGRVAFSPGPSFGPGGEGYARLNFATTPAILEEAVDRMAATVASPGPIPN
jgi:cystathionine beta-lyase